MTLRVLIVDDEPIARQRLARLLAQEPGVEIAGEAEDGEAAIARAKELRPDVVLLDIRMPGLDGLQAARAIAGTSRVIFTTAHDEHALQAFDAAAIDYLLKPVRPERLREALERARRAAAKPEAPAGPGAAAMPDAARIEALLRGVLAGAAREPQRLAARRGDVTELLDPGEISRIHADAGCAVISHGGREYVLDESLAALEQRLAPLGFLRVHRGELVNVALIRALHRQDDQAIAEMKDGQRAQVSRSHLPALKKALGLG